MSDDIRQEAANRTLSNLEQATIKLTLAIANIFSSSLMVEISGTPLGPELKGHYLAVLLEELNNYYSVVGQLHPFPPTLAQVISDNLEALGAASPTSTRIN